MRRALLLTASALWLSACASAPVYHRAQDAAINNPDAQGAFIEAQNKALAANAVPGDWWKLYDDPRLNGLIVDALTANTDLRAAAARVERARTGLDVARSAREVDIDTSAAVEYAKPSAEQYLLIGEHLPSDFLYAANAGVSYQIDIAGQVKSAMQAARADMASSQATYDGVRITVVADTTRAWLDACATNHQIAIARQALAVQGESTDIARRLVAAGKAGAIDVTRSTGAEAQTRAALPGLEAAHSAALYRLAMLTGRAPADLPPEAATCDTVPVLTQPIPVGDGAALLARRPDVRAREAELRGATMRKGVARAALYPQIRLGAGLTSTGLTSRFLQYDTNGYSLGPLISWSLPGERTKANIKAADAGIDEAQARFDGAVLAALRETETALNAYARDLDQRSDLARAHDQAIKSLAETQRLQKAGKINVQPVLDARRAVIAGDQALAQIDARLAADQVQVFLSLGGGWADPSPKG